MFEVFKRLYLNDFGVYAEQARNERVEVSPGGPTEPFRLGRAFLIAIAQLVP